MFASHSSLVAADGGILTFGQLAVGVALTTQRVFVNFVEHACRDWQSTTGAKPSFPAVRGTYETVKLDVDSDRLMTTVMNSPIPTFTNTRRVQLEGQLRRLQTLPHG